MKLNREKYITQEEFLRILYALKTRPHKHAIRDRAMLVTCALLGLRVKELISIRFADLRLSEDPPLVEVLTAKQREAKRRLIFDDVAVPGTALQALQKFVASVPKQDRLAWARLFPMTTRQAARIFKRYAKIANLNPRYSIHSLRHFRGMEIYRETKDLVQVKEALRHKDISITQIYLHAHEHLKVAASVDIKEQ